MTLKLYAHDMSLPCRAVYLTAAALGLELDIIHIDVWKKQQYTSSFLKINPYHTVPTLDDGGYIVWESGAINIYLISKYGKHTTLYPNDIGKRVIIHQMLFYGIQVMTNFSKIFITALKSGEIVSHLEKEAKELYKMLEKYLENNKWIAGDTVTLADLTYIPIITSLALVVPITSNNFPSLMRWIEEAKKLSYYHENEKGLNDWKHFIANKFKLFITVDINIKAKQSSSFIVSYYARRIRPSTNSREVDTLIVIQMTLKLYTQDRSAPCRAVYMLAAALELHLELIIVDVWNKQQYSPDFLKINPNHTIPTLDDDGTIIWDSSAINIYLVSKYGKNSTFYPENYKQRAIINQRLFYNAETVFPFGKRTTYFAVIRKPVPNKDVKAHKIYTNVEAFLKNNKWIAGDNITIADFIFIPNITTLMLLTPITSEKYPNITRCSSYLGKLYLLIMTLKLYSLDSSPPVRAVYLTAEALGLELERIDVNLLKFDNLKPEFLKKNPQHTVPTLDDDGKIIWDSHAIIIYLVSKYGKDKSLYPDDDYKRAIIHQRLHFESSLAFPAFIRIVMPLLLGDAETIPDNLIKETIQVYEFMEKFLTGNKWAIGDEVTLADLSLIPTVTTLNCLVPMDKQKYPNIFRWIGQAEKLSYYQPNIKGLESFRSKLKKFVS
ncbi:hypothetical protein FQA39_LY05420 [Lamprigera yunnana]|nr:hypothetical protein FQA39_LY05420 [Lamprigera yunnana]